MDAKQEEKIIEGAVDEEAVVAAAAAADARSDVAQAPTFAPATYSSAAPDNYAVGIHVTRMAPAWLLTASVSFALLLLLLSWIRPDASASGKASTPNDSRAPQARSVVSPAPVAPKDEQSVASVAPVAEGVGDKAAPSEAAITPAQPAPATSTSPAESHPAAVSPEVVSVAGAPEKQAEASGESEPKFTVQVGSHSSESSANEQVSRLRAAGFEASTLAVELPGRGKWYRVQAGSFDDRAAASKVAALLRAKGVAPAGIVVPRQ